MRKYQYIPVEDILKNDSLRHVYNFVGARQQTIPRMGVISVISLPLRG